MTGGITCCASGGTTQTCFLLRLQLHSARLCACRRSTACAFLQAAAGITGGDEGGPADAAEQPVGGEGEGEPLGGLDAPAEPPAHVNAAFDGAPLVRTPSTK